MNKNRDKQPIILVGGGTGGHIFPLIAVGEELASSKVPFIFVGANGGREEALIKELGWQFRPIAAGKLRRYLTLKTFFENIVDIFRSLQGFFQSIGLLLRTGAPAILSKGGYVALPMVCAARLLGRKIYIHESDAAMGLSNRISARFAKRIWTAFPPSVFPSADKRYQKIGIPIRYSLRQAAKLKAPAKTKPLVLIVGGIQGASKLNSLIRSNLTNLINKVDLIHVTGEREYEIYHKLQQSLDKKDRGKYKPFPFLGRELAYYFQTADVVVSRASATTIAEGALFSKAMYLIPLPTAAGNHQAINAKLLEQSRAAVVSEEYQLSNDGFAETLSKLLTDRERITTLGKNLHNYFHNEEAISLIVKEITNG